MCYMNAQKERESDSENFGEKSLNLELWLKSYEGLKFQGLFCKFPKKKQKIGYFWNYFWTKNMWTRSTRLWTTLA
jgi:hypothetical protein